MDRPSISSDELKTHEEADFELCGSGFKKSIALPPISKDWPVEDAFGRISALDAHKMAITYKSSFYNFINVMKDSQLHQMYVPAHFAAHLPKKPVELELCTVNGKNWTIKSSYVKDTRKNTNLFKHTFSVGFGKFIHDNEIKAGDVCIFELVEELKLKVLILKVRDPSPTFSSKLISHLKAQQRRSWS